MKISRKALIPAAVLFIAGISIAYYMDNNPHENMQRSKPAYEMDAQELMSAFETDEAAANEKYLDEVIAVSGTVRESSTDENGLTTVTLDTDNLMAGIICQLDELTEHDRTEFKAGEKVILKGKCTGFLMDVVMVRCVETS